MQDPNITIINQKGPTPAPEKPSRIDLQDALILAGFGSLETGVSLIYIPAALILAGLLFFLCALLIQHTRSVKR